MSSIKTVHLTKDLLLQYKEIPRDGVPEFEFESALLKYKLIFRTEFISTTILSGSTSKIFDEEMSVIYRMHTILAFMTRIIDTSNCTLSNLSSTFKKDDAL